MRRQSVGSLTDLQFCEEFSLTDTRVASSMLASFSTCSNDDDCISGEDFKMIISSKKGEDEWAIDDDDEATLVTEIEMMQGDVTLDSYVSMLREHAGVGLAIDQEILTKFFSEISEENEEVDADRLKSALERREVLVSTEEATLLLRKAGAEEAKPLSQQSFLDRLSSEA